jgi:putative ABC transport system ATP-binding protein
MIEVKNIIKDFKNGNTKTTVLHDINLNIESGKLTMLVGPSGCGKTTLISIITGILTPSSGEVIINDINLTALSDRKKVEFRRDKIGFIFQQYNLIPTLTAAENAAIPLIAQGINFEIAVSKAKKFLENIDMKDHANKLPNQLSGGQQQRVVIARALVHNPQVIVCDEPTAALDATTGQKVMEILKNKALDKNRIVIVVTHDNRIFEFADTIIHMNDGRIENPIVQ